MLKRLIEVQNLLQHQWKIIEQSKLSAETKALLDKENISATWIIRQLIDEVEAKSLLKGWKKGKGTILLTNGEEKEVEVYSNPDFKGLMVHRENEFSNYVITHEMSKTKMNNANNTYKSIRTALMACKKHLSGIDWARPQEEIKADPVAYKAFKSLNNK